MNTPEPFPSTVAITCDDCGLMMPKGTLVLYNAMQEYVHVVCPRDKPERADPALWPETMRQLAGIWLEGFNTGALWAKAVEREDPWTPKPDNPYGDPT